ncbi:MAG: uracil-DNA glycosylase [Negativicutes bacterium]|jgi:DNA polymerase
MSEYFKYPLWQPEEPVNTNIYELEKELLDCHQCALRPDCIAPTSFNGSITSPLMLVAEGPGGVEDEFGVPLVGKSGQLLDKALWSAKITRDRIYTSNVVKCRPLKNRTPTLDEGLFCGSKWLAKEIEIIKPKVILCLGSVSLRFFGNKDLKITQERGKWIANRFGVNVIATYHPAYLIRLGGDQLKKAKWDVYYDILAAKNKALEYYPDYCFTSDEVTPLLKMYADRKENRIKTFLDKE